jgi:hypothetical protein
MVECRIDCSEHYFDDIIRAKVRLGLAVGGRVHHVLIHNGISVARVDS